MASKLNRTPNATVFLAILLTALLVSAVVTQLRAQTPPTSAAPAVPATPENTTPVTPRTEAEAACRAIGNQEQRAQCLAALVPGGAAPGDTAPPPPAILRKPPPAVPEMVPPAPQPK